MASEEEFLDFPNDNVKKIVAEVAESEGLKEYETKLSSATAKGDNYGGIIYRANLTGKTADGEERNTSLILKAAPTYARDKFPIDTIFAKELYCYTDMLPALDQMQKKYNISENRRFKYVKFYKGDLTDLSEVIVLEDMNVSNFKMANRRISLLPEQMILVIKTLGALHASSFALRKHNTDRFNEIESIMAKEIDFKEMFEIAFNMSKNRAIDVMDDEVCKQKLINFGNGALQFFFDYITPKNVEPYSVLCHGDCWINNMLFRYENDKPVEVRLLDWQMVKHASPIVDIAYLMFSSTDENLRANHYEELLNIYYDTLKTNLALMECDVNVCYPREIFEKQIKAIMPFGLITAFITAPMFMSEDEDIIDVNELMKKDQINEDDMQLKNETSKSRYGERMRGVVRDFVRLDLI